MHTCRAKLHCSKGFTTTRDIQLIQYLNTERLFIEVISHILNDSSETYEEIRLVEVVRDIPANLAILASLLYHSMEEGQHIDQATEGKVWAFSQRLLGDFRVCRSHVELESVGRLCHYLHTI